MGKVFRVGPNLGKFVAPLPVSSIFQSEADSDEAINVAITQIISMKIYSVMYVPVITDMEQYIAVEGHPTQLPCDVTPPKPGEQVSLVLWYRQGDGGEPIYR